MDVGLTFLLYLIIVCSVSWCMKESCRNAPKSYRRRMFVAALMICCVFAALRGDTGTDSAMYRIYYQQGIGNFEIAYMLLMQGIKLLGLPYQMLFGVMSFLTMLCMFSAIRMERQNLNVFMATFICMIDSYFFSWNVMRQGLAIAICIYAMVLYLHKKAVWGIILIAVACLFHYSALICLIVVGAKILFDKRHSRWLMTIVFGLALYLVFHRELFGEWVEVLTGSSYYASYITRDSYTDGSLLTYYIKVLPIMLFATLGFPQYRVNRKYQVLYGLMISGFILSSLGSITGTQVQRMGYYFTYLDMLLLGYLAKDRLQIIKGIYLSKRSYHYIVYAYFMVCFIYNYFIRGFSDMVPYSWFA